MSAPVARPLAVDLDGSLLKTDLLQETASSFICRNPLRLPWLLFWLCSGGLCKLKEKLAAHYKMEPAVLPWNQPVLDWLRQQKAQGRQLVLATASHISLARQVQQHLQLFDDVMATGDDINLRREQKRQALAARFGEKGFDYLGNSRDDLAVWRSAGYGHVVSDSARLVTTVQQLCHVDKVFPSGRASRHSSIIRAMRPWQWPKNVLLLVPLMTSHSYGNLHDLVLAICAVAVFCLCSSSIYLLNDLVDCDHDRHHNVKNNRPFAASDLSLATGWILWPLLLSISIAIALTVLPPAFSVALFCYMLLAVSYSLLLKQFAIVDVLTLALLYTIRVIAGVAAIATVMSFWLLVFSMFIFLSLALVKRYSELRASYADNNGGKLRGRGYSPDDVEAISAMGIGTGLLAVLVLAFYIQDANTAILYQSHEFIWLACPVLLYWILRVWLLAHRGQMHHDPAVFAISDSSSWISGILFIAVFAIARFAG